jgi:hypothetical protein
MNSTVLLNKGMECLMEKLGLVEAERFISLLHVEPFDYTEWRKENLFKDMTVNELSAVAMEYRRNKETNRNYSVREKLVKTEKIIWQITIEKNQA